METLKKFIVKLLILSAVIVLVYGCFFSFRILQDGFIGVVKDVRVNKVVRVYHQKYNVILEGLNPLWYTLYDVPANRNISRELNLVIPELAELSNDRYKIRIPVSAQYIIDTGNPESVNFIWNNTESIDDKILELITLICKGEFAPYISPNYKRNLLLNNIASVSREIEKKIKNELSKYGLQLKSFSIVGSVSLPLFSEYLQAKRHIAELHRIEEVNENKLKEIMTKIEQNKIINKQYYDELTKISALIRDNPDLLKYIYIDKLSNKIMVVNSINDLDILGIFKKNQTNAQDSKGEIDNLR